MNALSLPRRAPSAGICVRQAQVQRRRVAARAENDQNGKRKSDDKDVKKAIEAMKKDGVDEKVARKVLKAWKDDQGVEGGDDLRKRVFGIGVSAVVLASVQLAIDIIASYSANQTAAAVGFSGVTGSQIGAILLQTLSIYFAINAALDLFRLGSVIGGTLVTGAKAESLYQAIEELAEEQNSIDILGKAEAAVNTSKVVLALNSVRKALQEEIADGKFQVGTLSTLTSIFVLQHAKDRYGWTPDKIGMSDDEAARAAATFGKFDRNEDNRLEFSEFKALCNAADFQLSDEESKKAVQLLDKRSSGYVEFDEFASWWKDQMGDLSKTPVQAAEGATA